MALSSYATNTYRIAFASAGPIIIARSSSPLSSTAINDLSRALTSEGTESLTRDSTARTLQRSWRKAKGSSLYTTLIKPTDDAIKELEALITPENKQAHPGKYDRNKEELKRLRKERADLLIVFADASLEKDKGVDTKKIRDALAQRKKS